MGEEIEYGLSNYEWCTLLSKEEYIKVFGCEYKFNFSYYEYRVKPKLPKLCRAELNGTYYFITTGMEICECTDTYTCPDYNRYNSGNYFRTLEVAAQALELMKACLIKIHNENDNR